MKARGSSIRFIFVSATVPNIEDVAKWVGRGPNGGPAVAKEVRTNYRLSALYAIHPYNYSSEKNSDHAS